MLGWALTFLVIALIAAALGFGGLGNRRNGRESFVCCLPRFVCPRIGHGPSRTNCLIQGFNPK